ncbi:2-aminoethylphosphonate ABC transporter permease, partial [Thioclava sp. BHET1]
MSETASRVRRPLCTGSVWVVLPLGLSAVVFFYPLSLVLREALTDGTGTLHLVQALRVLQSHIFLSALENTLRIAISAPVGCLFLGFVLGVVLAYVPFP